MRKAAEITELLFATIKETLAKGERVKVTGFGRFAPRDKAMRPGRDPRSGAPFKINARRVLTFKASQILRQNLNRRNDAAG